MLHFCTRHICWNMSCGFLQCLTVCWHTICPPQHHREHSIPPLYPLRNQSLSNCASLWFTSHRKYSFVNYISSVYQIRVRHHAPHHTSASESKCSMKFKIEIVKLDTSVGIHSVASATWPFLQIESRGKCQRQYSGVLECERF